MKTLSIPEWFRSGAPWIWLSAGAVALSIFTVASLIILLAVRGFGHFWPDAVIEFTSGARSIVGEIREIESIPASHLSGIAVSDKDNPLVKRYLIKTGNRDLSGSDFVWFYEVGKISYPKAVYVLERTEWGNFYGFLKSVSGNQGPDRFVMLHERLKKIHGIQNQIKAIQKVEIGKINFQLEKLRLEARRLELKGNLTAQNQARLEKQRGALEKQYQGLQQRLTELYAQISVDRVTMLAGDGGLAEIPLYKIVRAYQPNQFSYLEKLRFYFTKIWEFVSEEPREANTEGGIFPAIFGTVLMVLIMSILVTPMGVIAAVYLREYASQGFLTRLIRIAVNNLAGVPSIVYGIFGLGFFVYFLGGGIDQLFYPESLPAPVFGTPGLLWASVTLAILTLPVVIVATEEGLSRIPRSIWEGSLALGATKAETLWRTVIPMASPAIMTGLILAIARAAGEVAPLMLVGVVKLAPSLPLDENFPYLHLERKFMHLGFHIFDVGFQSPNVEAARPLVYATALLLVVVIIVLNLAAITVRNRLRERFRALES